MIEFTLVQLRTTAAAFRRDGDVGTAFLMDEAATRLESLEPYAGDLLKAAREFEAPLSYWCDGPERDALRAVMARSPNSLEICKGPQCPKAGESGSKPDCARFDSSGARQNPNPAGPIPTTEASAAERPMRETEASGAGRAGTTCPQVGPQQSNAEKIAGENAIAVLDYARDYLYNLVIREAGPKPVPIERLLALVERKLFRVSYLESIAPPLCPSCGCIREHQPCNQDGAITGCFDPFHAIDSQAPKENSQPAVKCNHPAHDVCIYCDTGYAAANRGMNP